MRAKSAGATCTLVGQAWSGVSSAQSSANNFGVLAEIHDGSDDDAPTLNRVKDAVGKTMNEQPAVSLVDGRRNLRKSAETPEGNIQVPHENLAPPLLIRLVEFVSGLDVGIGGE